MASQKRCEELHKEMVDLIPENKNKEDKEYVVINDWLAFSTDFICHDNDARCLYFIVHASCLLAAIVVVIDKLNDTDQKIFYSEFNDYGRLTAFDVKTVFARFFEIREHFPEKITHLYERGDGRLIKHAS